LKPEKKEAAALARTRIEFGLLIPFEGESRREKQISEAGAQVQSQVRDRPGARDAGACAVADSEVWAEMQAQVEEPTGQAELQILRAILERSGLSGWLAQIKDARGQSYFPTAMVP
jgi:hypothetical protein